MQILIPVIVGVIVFPIAFFIGYAWRKNVANRIMGNAEQIAQNKILDAESEAEKKKQAIVLEAKEEVHKIKDAANAEIRASQSEITKLESRITQKEDNLAAKIQSYEDKVKNLEEKNVVLDERANRLHDKETQIAAIIQKQNERLEKVSGYTKEEAKQVLLSNVESQIKQEKATLIKQLDEEAKEEADKNARNIIVDAIQRTASDHTAEVAISVISIPSDDIKGRIIGREGRNIRAIEAATGVEIVVDDTPETITVSAFDPVRRQIAAIAITKLIADGRIHPAKIDEMVAKAKKEVNAAVREAGKQAAYETGVHNLHPELVNILGRLKYRTSFGQNALNHSIEVAHLAGLMAGELGLDPKLAKRAGLLHDIGKAEDHQVEGTHVDIGIDILKKYKESEEVIWAMRSHHGDYEPKNMEAVLIEAADAMSAARPGARSEIMDSYVKRISRLEELVSDTKGVENVYAVQAGREVRVIVNPEEINDADMVLLARDISEKIQSELKYPGQIKVNVIRETRAIDFAK
jgi:ribonuclease Y